MSSSMALGFRADHEDDSCRQDRFHFFSAQAGNRGGPQAPVAGPAPAVQVIISTETFSVNVL
jgi:hypothetical protein